MAVVSPPYLLGAAGQVMSGRLARLSLGAAFRPAGSGVQVVSGVLAGPPNTMGELALPSGTQLTVQPFRAVIQSALDATAGSYEVTNDAAVTLPVAAQHASQFRRSLIVVRVDDSQVSGVASSATTDRATLEVLDGALAVSAAAATLPAATGSWLALGEVLIPPAGQTVTFTPYNPRTGIRHGILPVINDSSTVTGHSGVLPAFDGQYRDHPVYGLQRGVGGAWRGISPTLLQSTVVDGTFYAVSHAVMTLPVPDPGHPYRLACSGSVGIYALGAGVTVAPQVQVNGAAIFPVGANITNGGGSSIYAVASILGTAVSGTLTGASTVTLYFLKSGTAGNGFIADSTPGYPSLSALVVPA